jgi:hypothetical protein
MENAVAQLKETGVIEEAKQLMSIAKGKMASFGVAGANWQDLRETNTAIKEMVESIRDLVNEARITISSSKKSGTIHSIKGSAKEVVDVYNIVANKAEVSQPTH